MRKIARLMAFVLLLAFVGCDGADVTSSLVSSEDVSVAETSSEDASAEVSSGEVSSEDVSSEDTSSEEGTLNLLDYVMADGFLDVEAASKDKNFKRVGINDTPLFAEVEGIKGYEINGGLYWVDEETIRRLAETPCRGDGSIKWLGFKNCGSWSTSKNNQPDHAPADLINDPLYMSMILPSERRCFMADRINASLLDIADDKWINVMTIGAVYKNSDVEIPDDAEFTLCISDINLAVRTTNSNGWYKAVNITVPSVYNRLYLLPWGLEHTSGTYNFPDGDMRVTYYSDHVEIKLKGEDLNGTNAKKLVDKVQQCVYHFWGQKHYFDCKGSEVLGVACSYTVWVKEPEAAEYLVAGIGADWRDSSEKPLQAFAGYKHAVTNEPTIVVGHNVAPSDWDEIVGDESEKIQKYLGMK